jgi:hypothetical protein
MPNASPTSASASYIGLRSMYDSGRLSFIHTAQHVTGPYRFVVCEGVDHWIQERVPDLVNAELLAHLAAHPGVTRGAGRRAPG